MDNVRNIFCRKFSGLIYLILIITAGCNSKPAGNIAAVEQSAQIYPDYSAITIPPNIAPLNFKILESGKLFYVRFKSDNGYEIYISSKNGKIQIPQKKWEKLLKNNGGKFIKIDIFSRNADGSWQRFREITNKVASDPIDNYIYYRILYPGYESWMELSINYRDLHNFKSGALIENSILDENCINCHSFNNGKTGDFLFHARGNMGGTYFYSKDQFRKVNLKTREMKNGAVYPRWHPSGKFVAFSSNKIIQQFHSADNKKIEVSDLESSLVLYDTEKNEITDIETGGKDKFMDTYPEWSPDGKYLFFCRAVRPGKNDDVRNIRYSICRTTFDISKRSFGETEIIYDAASDNKSAVFPRISPNGKFLVITQSDYGCFPIWHKEADLYSINLDNLKAEKLNLNSEFSESYHSWSSNGKWIIFSSKRGDGLTARPYIAYIEENGNSDKPFILPQYDPDFYNGFLKSFNIPEFSTLKVKLTPGNFRRMAEQSPVQAKWTGTKN